MEEPSELCLHPYRKRKFFYGLAELFGEEPPLIQRIEDVFPASAEPVDETSQRIAEQRDSIQPQTESQSPSHGDLPPAAPSSASQDTDEDSFEFVELGKPRASMDSSLSLRTGLFSQSSAHDSMQDSLLFLPPELKLAASIRMSFSQTRELSEEERLSQPTVLSMPSSTRAKARLEELIDYYDLDRLCEPVPCWAYENQSSCPLHTQPIRRPMLFFCLQTMDEFIASTSILDGESAIVHLCRLARAVFSSMWEQDMRLIGNSADVVIMDYLSQKRVIPGISVEVWRIIDACWRRHKQSYLHHQELYFVENDAAIPSVRVERWRRIRSLLQIYGLRPSQARRLVAADEEVVDEFSERELDLISHGFPSVVPVQVGMVYLDQVQTKSKSNESICRRRDVISQDEWKQAFKAIQIHFKQWSGDVRVYPCGSFSRGAAFGSVIDMVVGLPAMRSNQSASPLDQVLEMLQAAKVIQKDRVEPLSASRAVAMIPFMDRTLLLDVKVYRMPQSLFALLYYTGPESFSRWYFTKLLKRSLSELNVVDFDHIYEAVIQEIGLEALAAVEREEHLFDLINSNFVVPQHRM